MIGSDFVPCRREWLDYAFRQGCPAEMVEAVLNYGFEGKRPPFKGNILNYFNEKIAPVIDRARAEYRQFDRRHAQFNEIIKDLPEKLRDRFRVDFSRLAFADEEDFLAFLEELTEDVKPLLNYGGTH